MKPITHPLAIALLDAIEASPTNSRLSDRAFRARVDWSRAGYPRYADPTPMPAPALGMRVWHREGAAGIVEHVDIKDRRYTNQWHDVVIDTDDIDLITDFRTGEVIWRRS